MKILYDIFSYAFRGKSKEVFFICILLWIISKIAGLAPLFGPIADILFSGYFCAFFIQIVQSTATGGKEVADFPDINSLWEDVIYPIFQFLASFFISFGGLLCYVIFVNESDINNVVFFGLLAFGIIYFPMALLSNIIFESLFAISPHIVIPAVFRAGFVYWVGIVLFFLIFMFESFISSLFSDSFFIGT